MGNVLLPSTLSLSSHLALTLPRYGRAGGIIIVERSSYITATHTHIDTHSGEKHTVIIVLFRGEEDGEGRIREKQF